MYYIYFTLFDEKNTIFTFLQIEVFSEVLFTVPKQFNCLREISKLFHKK